MTATLFAQKALRASHRRVLQLFRTYGPMNDQALLEVARAEGWDISPSGLRSRRAELTRPERGSLVIDTGRREKTRGGREAVIWSLADGA